MNTEPGHMSGTVIRIVFPHGGDVLFCDPERGGCGVRRLVPHGQTVVQSARQSGHICGDPDWPLPDYTPPRTTRRRQLTTANTGEPTS